MKNLPQKPGFYWARSELRMGWYNYIVRVYGDAPFFRMEGWLLNSLVPNCQEIHLSDICDFGPEIIQPEVPKEIIQK